MSNSATDHFDIQAIVRGFGPTWPHAVFVYGGLNKAAAENRAFMTAVFGQEGPTSVKELDARRFELAPAGAVNIALTFTGLTKLGIRNEFLHTFPQPFAKGMAERKDINGDYGRSAPERWEKHWQGSKVDCWIGLYARTETQRDQQYEQLARQMKAFGIEKLGCDRARRLVSDDTEVYIDEPGCQPPPGLALEHFGFCDGMSDPPVRGLTPPGSPLINGAGRLDAKGNWHPLAAGEFLLGHLDEIGEIPPAPEPTRIARNGTFLVLRKLSQDVDGFRCYLKKTVKGNDLTADELAEKMIGRKRSGAPLVELATRAATFNDFVYGTDQRGQRCPLGSHIRRANPRDTLGNQSLLVDRHRILRRAIPYGDLVPREAKQKRINDLEKVPGVTEPYPGQGLLFVALNVDLDRQFEFVQSQWINLGNDLSQGSDRDPVVGSHDPEAPSHMIFPTEDDRSAVVCPNLPRFVETRGGDYFFLPGVDALTRMANGEFGDG